ncbi:polymorphic toxin-type HINT domain-containing protein [Actinoplanes sp. TRM 88003]|uniref:Polymorphic toxin-type HINT domain-containing protein n=1 Tax=Paractinoplanes aksuensis TaxID=2939490 RepID=A0ABT1DS66_9ACTN|nr:RHS repeat-associated core domain-containing protein [Actinoplanes aksuensis]MCO8273674.1 polymorphic toxin-type HINT domain-containing protein [Actinoplanes aksuensis]
MLSKKRWGARLVARRRRFAVLGLVVAAGPALIGLTPVAAVADPKGVDWPEPKPLERVQLDRSKKAAAPKVPAKTYAKFAVGTNASLPAAQDSTVRLTGRTKVRAGSSPVSVARGAQGSAPEQVRVTTVDQKTAQAAGVRGVMFALRGTGAAGQVDVEVDPSTFRNAYGGGYESRLRLVQLPACALTTPELEQCRVRTPLPALTGTPLAASASVSSGVTVLAAEPDASGRSGDFKATDLSAGGSWSTSGNTGAFTYNYPISVPSAVGGGSPALSLSYSSSSQDARTLGTNNQSSWVGDGWNTPDNFIERTYRSCEDVEGSGAPEHSGDLCWAGQILTLSLNGSSTEIVYDDKTKTFRSANDSATTKIESLTGATNETKNGEYFRVIENGVQYYFGLNRLPGWTSGKDETKSVRTVPVYKAHGGVAACPDGSFAATSCKLGYRFGLDLVVDRNSNAMAYYYGQETNFYGANMKDTAVEYVRGGTLKRIEYGLRAGSVYSAPPSGKITFNTTERCFPGEPAGNTCASDQFGVEHAEYWPDVPVDLNCTSGKDCINHAPSFWSRRRLASIVTEVLVDGEMTPVDRYDLTQTLPDGGDHAPTLWLQSIKHTGLDKSGGATATADGGTVSFNPAQLFNRVGTLPGLPKMWYNRIGNVTSATGAETVVTYDTPTCSGLPASDLADENDTKAQAFASTNKTGCFPVYWTPQAQPRPLIDWFYTHPVKSVVTLDNWNKYQDGTQPKLVTEYAYEGDPGWHYDDNEVVEKKNRTWGQFRGYPEVHVTTGDTSVFHKNNKTEVYDRKTLTKTYYFLGMNGDVLPGGKTRSVPALSSTDGTVSVTDSPELAGQVFETVTYTGVGGTPESATVSVPKIIGPTASRARTGLPTLEANMVVPSRTLTRQKASYGWRRTEVATFYNTTLGQSTTGMAVQQVDRGETGATGNVPLCTFNKYVDLTVPIIGGGTAGIVLPSELIKTNQDCAAAGATPSGTLISDARTLYDAAGNPTLVKAAATASGTTVSKWLDTSSTAYDMYGRAKTVTRTPNSTGLAQAVHTRYSPSTGELPKTLTTVTQVTSGTDCSAATVSSKDCQVATMTLAPARQLPIAETDIAGGLSSAEYDGLGRLTSAWLPNKSREAKAPANMKYEYLLRSTAPSVVTTQTLADNDKTDAPITYIASKVLHDAMLRPLETQSTGENGATIVSDVQYDSHGWTVLTNDAYAVDGSPGDSLISDHLSQVSVPSTTVIDHDAMGRVTQTTAEHNGVETFRTRTAHTGDKVTTVPPTGGIATTRITNARGKLTELQQYTTVPTLSGSVTAGFTASGGVSNSIKYEYTDAGMPSKTTGPDQSTWVDTYDLLGRKTKHVDPDTGTSLTQYDDAGNPTLSKDGRGVQLSYTFDLLGRQLTGTKVSTKFQFASWTYDTLRIGSPTSSTRKVSGVEGGYTVEVAGYSKLGRSMGQKISLPSAEAPLPVSYETSFAYTPNNELLARQTDPAVAGLPEETITYGRGPLGTPTSTKGIEAYISGTIYTEFGQPSKVTLGPSTKQAEVMYEYDPYTLRRSGRTVSRAEGIGPVVDQTNYTYDDAGNPLSVTNKQTENGNPVTDTQCYRYDSLARLADAWTASGACPAANVLKPAAGGVASGTGSYWQSFTYDAIGSRRQLVDHSTTGGADVTTAYTLGCSTGCNGTGAQPHTLTETKGNADPTKFVYDVGGNLLTRTATSGKNQTLKWDDEGRLAEVATSNGTTKFVYDADGNQLIRRDPKRTSLFAGDTEVVIDTTAPAKPVSLGAVRTYSHGGAGPVAIRSTLPGGGAHYLISDSHNNATLTMDTSTQAVARQQFKPYGEDRANANPTAWPDMTRGYLGAPRNIDTGYTDVGARKYDPVLGRFISPDPILELTDPSQLGGYTYAGDNPITHSDPSGLRIDPTRPGCEEGNGGACGGKESPRRIDVVEDGNGGGTVGGVRVTNAQVKGNVYHFEKELDYAYDQYQRAWGSSWDNMDDDKKMLYMMNGACQGSAGYGSACSNIYANDVKNALNVRTVGNLIPGLNSKDLGEAILNSEGGAPASALISEGKVIKAATKVSASDAYEDLAAMAKGVGKACVRGNSFSPDTEVLMADGSTKPISEVREGDEVLATDPGTGETTAQQVTALHVNIDTALADLTVELADGRSATVHTTRDHPFWTPQRNQWTGAGLLDPGEDLTTTSPLTRPEVDDVRVFAGRQVMFDLTVEKVHTYYVLAGGTPVLVHNTDCLPTAGEAQDMVKAAEPVGSALKEDRWHRSAAFVVDDIAENGTVFRITGGDGVERTLVQMPGEVNDIPGRFEWILDGSNLTHSMFVKNGTINGVPIKP